MSYYHTFYIPVMGTGHSVDTPIRVAPFGISSVISFVDDILLEKVGNYYRQMFGLPQMQTLSSDLDRRAKRIYAYLETVQEIVSMKIEAIKKQSFFEDNDKKKYFELLPSCPLKKDYLNLFKIKDGPQKDALAKELNEKIKPGSIDVNIKVKLDKGNYDGKGQPLGEEFTDAKAALRGYANSTLKSCIVFSAGVNQRLFTYMTHFRDFYRDKSGEIKKKIILKVTDCRSALIQAKFLAKKGLEVYEYRIESSLNCGGHAFSSNGHLLPYILKEFKDKREQLKEGFMRLVQNYYKKMGWEYSQLALDSSPLVTVQGGLGIYGEKRRLMKAFGVNLTGWASPFLLVPEATCVDSTTLNLLIKAGKKDLYLSNVSPLGVPFNNVHQTGSEKWTKKKAEEGKPGSACPKGLLASNTEFSEKPICLASGRYQKKKLEEIAGMPVSQEEKEKLSTKVKDKTCLCDHLGNGALIALGIAGEDSSPQSICPGPNIAWFNKSYSLKEMVDHIYGRGPSLVSPDRPHMFVQEIIINVDYFKKLVTECSYSAKEIKLLQEYKNNLENSMNFCLTIVAQGQEYPDENLASIPIHIKEQKNRLNLLYEEFEKKVESLPNPS